MKQKIIEAIATIDEVFGKGYAKKHPKLIGQIVIAGELAIISENTHYIGT